MFHTNFLTAQESTELVGKHGAPLFVYSRQHLQAQARAMRSVPAPYGLTVRYAMKANPNPDILEVFRAADIQIDASSGYEAELALQAGFSGEQILLTSQQLAHNLGPLMKRGVEFTATSLHQLESY